MRTEDLIARLAAETRPVPKGAVSRRLSRGLLVGGVAAFAVLLTVFGMRADLAGAVLGGSFWMKAAYTAIVGLAGLGLMLRLARPGARPGALPWIVLGLATALIAVLAAGELATAAPADRMEIWLGHSWRQCPVRILLISAPLLVAGLLAMRRLAPTRPTTAGLAVGLAAGGLGATVYGLHCTESTAAFLATWYVLGMAAVGALGALIGARLLRW
ncbi:MAG: NrsF family protein [Pseudomonadota bacterium]